MAATGQQKQLAQQIDLWVKDIESKGNSDERLLKRMHQQMDTFKKLLDTTTHEQMNELGDLYSGFYRFAHLLERLAQGIHAGVIVPPKS